MRGPREGSPEGQGEPMWRRSLALRPWWAGLLLQQRFCSSEDLEDQEEGEDGEEGEERGWGGG